MSWSVRYGARSAYAPRVFDDIVEQCHHSLATHLPSSSGYDLRVFTLQGAIRGQSLRVRRGTFEAVISIQRFAHHLHDAAGVAPTELRVVATSTSGTRALPPSPRHSKWKLTSGAAASLGIGALALAVSGNLTAWATAVLLIPGLFATRLCTALWLADNMRRKALPPAGRALPASTQSAAAVRDGRRWASVVADLQRLHETTAERFVVRPFRGLGSTGAQRAIGPGALRPAG